MSGAIGRYDLVAHLATGGMGQVFLARSGGIGGFVRHVVLKTLDLPGTDEDEAIAMFLDEARLVGLLHHQHIAPVYEVGKDDAGHFYLVMDYVHGHTAHDVWVRTNELGAALPIDFSLTVAAGAASGLHYAHTRRGPDGRALRIVHRDVTLSNLMIGFDGAVKLIDFGIAKAANRSTQTQVGFIKGKIGYMAPEQLRGHAVDARTDVFALGIVLYELTTMRRAFRAEDDRATMERIKQGAFVLPSTLNPDYPPELERIVTRALRVDPRERYPDCEAMRRELDLLGHRLGLVLGDAAIVEVMTQLFEQRQEPWERPVRPHTELDVSLEIVPAAVHEDESTRPTSRAGMPLRAATEAHEAALETPPHGVPKRLSSFTISFDGGAPQRIVPRAESGPPAVPLPPPPPAAAGTPAPGPPAAAIAPLSNHTDGVPVLPPLAPPAPVLVEDIPTSVKGAAPPARAARPAPKASKTKTVRAVSPPGRRTALIGWVAFGVLAAAALGGGIYVLQSSGSAPAAANSGDPATAGSGDMKVTLKPSVPLSPSVMDEPPAPAPAPTSPPAPKPPVELPPGTPISFQIKTVPPDATVLLDGRRLGRTPYSGTVEAAPGTHVMRIRRKGYRTIDLEIELNGAVEREVTLQRDP